MTSHTVYEDAMWLPWIQKNVLHRPADGFFRTTKCGIFVGDDVRVRSTDLLTEDERGFTACPECFESVTVHWDKHGQMQPGRAATGNCFDCGRSLTTEEAIRSDACLKCDPAKERP